MVVVACIRVVYLALNHHYLKERHGLQVHHGGAGTTATGLKAGVIIIQ